MGPHSGANSASGCTRDPLLCCEPLVILVGSTLFNVPKSVFQESPVFQNMFAMPAAPGQTPDGASDAQPLRLDGVAAADFRALMHYLLPIAGRPEPDVAAWTSTLRLANLWELARTRADAIAHLDRLITGPAARIRLAREMAISSWQVPALEALVLQEAALTAAQAEQLGLDTILKLAALRKTYGSARCPLTGRTSRPGSPTSL